MPSFADFFDPYFGVIHLPLVFILGAAMGSFFNVCIYRIPRGMSLSHPGSHCYRCGRPVRWFDNIPLFSYWILRGRCRDCGASFSMRYFAVELLTACLFTLCYLKIGYSLTLFAALVFISLLIVGSFTDIDHWIIPDRVTLGGLVVGIVLAAIWPLGLARANPLASSLLTDFFPIPKHLLALSNSLVGAAAGFVMLWSIGAIGSVIFRKEAMGFGDVKLFAMFGAFCGPEYLLYILILACLFGTAAGMVGIVRGKRAARAPVDPAVAPLAVEAGRTGQFADAYALSADERLAIAQALDHPGAVGTVRHHLPFGPSLALAAVVVYLYGAEISRWFTRLMLV